MERYNHDCGCSKCGQKDIANRFVQKGNSIDFWIGDTTDVDIIRRYCRNCQYKWSELPIKNSKEVA